MEDQLIDEAFVESVMIDLPDLLMSSSQDTSESNLIQLDASHAVLNDVSLSGQEQQHQPVLYNDPPSSPYFDPPPMFLDPSAIIITSPDQMDGSGQTQTDAGHAPAGSGYITITPVTAASSSTSKSNGKAGKSNGKDAEKPHQCSVCGRGYKTRNGMIRHQKDAHNLMNPLPKSRKIATTTATADSQMQLMPDGDIIGSPDGQPAILPPASIKIKKPRPKKTDADGQVVKKVRKKSKKEDQDATISSTISTPLLESGIIQIVDPEDGFLILDEQNGLIQITSQSEVKPGKIKSEKKVKKTIKKEEVTGEDPVPKPKRKSTINGWVDGKVHHKENGINNKMLHERPKGDSDEPEVGKVRKLYCKNSRWKRLEDKWEEEEKRKRNDPKLLMDCFVELTDILNCYVHLEESERNGMRIFV